jgi:hypothetical protein
MAHSKATARDYIQAMRPQNSMLTALAVTFPTLLVSRTIDWRVIELLVFGYLMNSAASIHNNITDFSYDLKVRYTSDRVVGSKIPMAKALAFYAILLCLSALLGLHLAGLISASPVVDLWALFALFFTMGIVTLYNLVGKTHWSWGICISLGIASLVWFGSIISGQFQEYLPYDLFILVFLALQSGFMQNWEGGLKDVATDASNMAAAMGVKVTGQNISISPLFKATAWAMKAVMAAILFYTVYITTGLTDPAYAIHPIFLAEILLTALSAAAAAHLLGFRKFQRARIIRSYGYHEALMWVMVPVLVYPIIGLWLALFAALLPLIFYVIYNSAVHGTMLVPDI